MSNTEHEHENSATPASASDTFPDTLHERLIRQGVALDAAQEKQEMPPPTPAEEAAFLMTVQSQEAAQALIAHENIETVEEASHGGRQAEAHQNAGV